jgi:acyl CoA:acetate/3-ketoacid CoA transferase alpha subunit/acyl CoA:acetate/3-ketoacid CoA transferase beta subunit
MTCHEPKMKMEFLGKIRPLRDALHDHVKPGMKLHIAGGIGGAGGAICEIIRQFRGQNPGFELIQSTVAGHAITLLYSGLLKKMVFSACVDISNTGHPSKIMQKKWADKTVEFENWSLCSLQQRLLAGALGISFMPTRSIAGSNMAFDNSPHFKELIDPFEDGSTIGIVAALNPDLSIVHGCAADVYGNTILAIPYGDDIWGALASRNGVVVTVEEIVPTEIIRRHAALVKIPGHIVRAVSVVPLGVHPFSLANPGISGFSGYESDLDFLEGLHKASTDEEQMEAWLNEWVLSCSDHSQYLKKLGEQRISSLLFNPLAKTETVSTSTLPACRQCSTEYNSEEMMLIAAAREIMQSMLNQEHRIVLLGAGSRSVAVLLAYHQLKAKGYEIEIITGNGQYGYDPLPSELALQSLVGVYSSKMVMDTITSQGVLIGGKNNRCLGVLGAGQIDKYGNTNSTLTSSGQFLVGSGGSNDVGNAREVIVILNQSKDRFVDELPYITCPGNRVTTIVSSMGIFKKEYGKEELYLAACFPDKERSSLEQRTAAIQEHCSWQLKVKEKVLDIAEPTEEELKILRSLISSKV